jgi:hypothetical protein
VVEVEVGQHEVERLDALEQRAVGDEALEAGARVDQDGGVAGAQQRAAGGVRGRRDPPSGAEDPQRGHTRIVA